MRQRKVIRQAGRSRKREKTWPRHASILDKKNRKYAWKKSKKWSGRQAGAGKVRMHGCSMPAYLIKKIGNMCYRNIEVIRRAGRSRRSDNTWPRHAGLPDKKSSKYVRKEIKKWSGEQAGPGEATIHGRGMLGCWITKIGTICERKESKETRPSEANDASFSDFFIFHFLTTYSFLARASYRDIVGC